MHGCVREWGSYLRCSGDLRVCPTDEAKRNPDCVWTALVGDFVPSPAVCEAVSRWLRGRAAKAAHERSVRGDATSKGLWVPCFSRLPLLTFPISALAVRVSYQPLISASLSQHRSQQQPRSRCTMSASWDWQVLVLHYRQESHPWRHPRHAAGADGGWRGGLWGPNQGGVGHRGRGKHAHAAHKCRGCLQQEQRPAHEVCGGASKASTGALPVPSELRICTEAAPC